MTNPFEYVDAVSYNKKDVIRTSNAPDLAEKGYDPHLTNRSLSYHPDAILFTDEMNRHYDLPKLLQYDFYLHGLKKRKRFGKWSKPNRAKDIDLIARALLCNRQVAEQYLRVLTPEQLDAFRDSLDLGGISKP